MSMVGKKATEGRKSSFKNTGFGRDDIRKRREDTAVEIRKNKREESLQKRRNFFDYMDGEEDRASTPTTTVIVFFI